MRALTWTDEDLRRTIPQVASWTALVNALGGSSISAARRMRTRAEAIGVDYSHFRGQRRWSDEDLVRSVNQSKSWSEVVSRLGKNPSGDMLDLVRKHAARLGLVAKFEKPERSSASDRFGRTDTRIVGQTSQFIAAAWFSQRGHRVALASEGAPYDLLVEQPGPTFDRVQVKTGGGTAGYGGKRTASLQRHVTWKRGASRMMVPYDPQELDYFFIVTPEALYLIPVSQVAGQGQVTLHPSSPWAVLIRGGGTDGTFDLCDMVAG